MFVVVEGGKTVEGNGLGFPDELFTDRLGAEIGDGSLLIDVFVPNSVGQSLKLCSVSLLTVASDLSIPTGDRIVGSLAGCCWLVLT